MGLLQMGSLHWQSDWYGLQVLAVQPPSPQSARAYPLNVSAKQPTTLNNTLLMVLSLYMILLYIELRSGLDIF